MSGRGGAGRRGIALVSRSATARQIMNAGPQPARATCFVDNYPPQRAKEFSDSDPSPICKAHREKFRLVMKAFKEKRTHLILWCDSEFRSQDGGAARPYELSATSISQHDPTINVTRYDRTRPKGQRLSRKDLDEFHALCGRWTSGRRAGVVACWGTPERRYGAVDLLAAFRAVFPQVRPSGGDPMSFAMDALRLLLGVDPEGAHHALKDCHDTSAIVLALIRATDEYCTKNGCVL